MMKRELTGWHVLAIFGGCFAVIIGVNLTLAFKAVQTFPGLETRNSYVASQHFNADRAAQDALGWDVQAQIEGGTLTVSIHDAIGKPLRPDSIEAILGRATSVAQDRQPVFEWNGQAFTAPVDVAPGYWNLRIEMTAADGTLFRRRIPLEARG